MTVISWMSKLQISLLSKLFSGKIDCLHNISLCARKNEIFMYCIMNQWGIKILGRVSGLWKMKNCHYSISVNRCLWSVGFANLDLCHRRNISYTLKLIPAAAFRWGKYSCKDLIYSSILWLFTSSLWSSGLLFALGYLPCFLMNLLQLCDWGHAVPLLENVCDVAPGAPGNRDSSSHQE